MSKKKKPAEAGTPISEVPTKKDEHFAFCKSCNGKGIDTTDPDKLCPVCDGSGMVKA